MKKVGVAEVALNEKGQEGAGFRLLIEAVLVVFILVIILGVINQVNGWRCKVSEQRLFEGFSKALNSPDGSVIVEKDIVLCGSSYSNRAFAGFATGISFDCIEIGASNIAAFRLLDKRAVEITTQIQADIYYKCLPGAAAGEDQCETYCTIGFGKDLKKED